jgi:hypothetical protein
MQATNYAWYSRLFEDPEFVQKYIDRWAVLRTNIFATSNLFSRIDQWTAYLNEAQARNYQRWPTIGKFVHPNYFIGHSYQNEIHFLKQWIRGRLDWIDGQGFPAPRLATTNSPGALALDAEGGKIYYTLDGSDPRLFGGKISQAAKEYTAPIPRAETNAIITTRVRSDYDLWSPPAVFSPR